MVNPRGAAHEFIVTKDSPMVAPGMKLLIVVIAVLGLLVLYQLVGM